MMKLISKRFLNITNKKSKNLIIVTKLFKKTKKFNKKIKTIII